jgi:hypothetical protein
MARVKYALATGSPTIVLRAGRENGMWTEWWYHQLRPFVDYWPIRSVFELPGAVRYLLDHPDEAAAIGAAGRAFVQDHLSESAVRCYWTYYLTYLGSVFAPGGVRVDWRARRINSSEHTHVAPVYYADDWDIGYPSPLPDRRVRRALAQQSQTQRLLGATAARADAATAPAPQRQQRQRQQGGAQPTEGIR